MIRLAVEDDCSSILNIYAPFISDTAITFEYKIPSLKEFGARMAKIQKTYPWLVCEIGGEIAGYAYASRYGEREAFDWSVELSIYISPDFQRKSIGKALYCALLDILKLQGFYNAYALVSVPNAKSEKLHESFGFETVGQFRNVGYKLKSWRNIKTFGLKLNEYENSPEKPKAVGIVSNAEECRSIVKKAEKLIIL